MAEAGGRIEINRAPVLTLWAAVVAERLGHDRRAALTLAVRTVLVPLASLPAVIISITAPAVFVVEFVRVRVAFALSLVVIRPQGWRSQSENSNQPQDCESASCHKFPCLFGARRVPCKTSLLSAAYIRTAMEVLGKEVPGTSKFLHGRELIMARIASAADLRAEELGSPKQDLRSGVCVGRI